MRTITLALILLITSACSSTFLPSFALYAEGDAIVRVVAGTEYVVLQGGAGGALRVMTRLAPNGVYTEAGSLPVGAGATRSWRVTWGGIGTDGWIDLTPVPCDEAVAVYPWVECPDVPTVLKSESVRESVRFSAYVERR